ncbi:unnamed protein product [Symbiodinium sp. CCMP2456]|nr:unnamed protein product [Symbiodinium sp. CCMP2456]
MAAPTPMTLESRVGSFQTDSDVDCAGHSVSSLDSLKPGVLNQMKGMDFDRLTEIQQLALLTPHLVLKAQTLRNPTKLLLLIQARQRQTSIAKGSTKMQASS